MKKMITLLIAAGAFVAVNAQSTRDEARKVILGQEKNKGTSTRDRDVVLGRDNRNDYPNYPNSGNSGVDQINREYDAKIWSIRNNNSISADEKARIIRQLEKERAQKIRSANRSYGKNYGKKNKRYGDDDDDRYKNNRGKQKGWPKGKGNKHRARDDD